MVIFSSFLVVLGGFSINVFNVFSPSPFPKQGITQDKTKVRKAQPHLVKQSIYLNPRESVSFSFVSLAYFLKTVNSFVHTDTANSTFRSGTPARNNAKNFLKSKSICSSGWFAFILHLFPLPDCPLNVIPVQKQFQLPRVFAFHRINCELSATQHYSYHRGKTALCFTSTSNTIWEVCPRGDQAFQNEGPHIGILQRALGS